MRYIEFELLAQPSDVPKQTPLAIVAGPVRVNAETELREFMRIDMGRCLREIARDSNDFCEIKRKDWTYEENVDKIQ